MNFHAQNFRIQKCFFHCVLGAFITIFDPLSWFQREKGRFIHIYPPTSLHASFTWRKVPDEVNPVSYCILKSDQSSTSESSSSWLKGLSRVSGSRRSRRSSWTRDREPRFPESQPTVSAARPGDSSAEGDNKVWNTGKYPAVLQHIANNDRASVKLIFFCKGESFGLLNRPLVVCSAATNNKQTHKLFNLRFRHKIVCH